MCFIIGKTDSADKRDLSGTSRLNSNVIDWISNDIIVKFTAPHGVHVCNQLGRDIELNIPIIYHLSRNVRSLKSIFRYSYTHAKRSYASGIRIEISSCWSIFDRRTSIRFSNMQMHPRLNRYSHEALYLSPYSKIK